MKCEEVGAGEVRALITRQHERHHTRPAVFPYWSHAVSRTAANIPSHTAPPRPAPPLLCSAL